MLSAIERHSAAHPIDWRKIHPFLLPGLFAAMLAASAWWISCERANPDLWLQLLAAEGILDGRGYGFEEQGKWISIADRPPITRWPPGISMIAAAITMLGGDPLIFLTHAYPILLGASYLIVFAALRTHVPFAAASIGAFYALSFHSVIQSHRVLQSEPLALFLSLVIAKLCAESDFRSWSAIKIVVIGFLLTMIRASGAFIVCGAIAAYVFRNQSRWSRRVAYSVALIGVTLLPILLLQSGDSATAKPVVVLKEIIGNSLPAVELIGPHFYPNGRLLLMRFLLATALLVLIASVTLRKRKADIGTVSLIVFFAYISMLAYSSSRYEYSWWTLYRVTGFVLPFIAIAFVLILPKKRLWLAFLLFVSLGHLGQTLLTAERQPGYKEVRDIIHREMTRLRVEEVCVGEDSREILRLLWYSRRHYQEIGGGIKYGDCGGSRLSVVGGVLVGDGEVLRKF